MPEISATFKEETQSLSPTKPLTFIEILFEDHLANNIALRFTDGDTVNWKGQTWSNQPFKMTSIIKSSSGEVTRPKLTLPNDQGLFSAYVSKKVLDFAEVNSFKCSPLELDTFDGFQQSFVVSHVVSLSQEAITMELRRASDGNNFRLPPKRYTQPEFPTVIV